ncbi:MAG TPA: DUF4238 domain-containing protein [Terriglobales bacterium]|nr:DUF4238 domain-containing protein [Terriglobales bacterium]
MRLRVTWIAPVASNEPRRHHSIPQIYLSGFTHNGGKKSRLFVVDLDGKSFWSTPANVEAERDFNRSGIEGKDPHALERALSAFESKRGRRASTLLRREEFRKPEAWIYVLNLAALLAVRNPGFGESMRHLFSDLHFALVQHHCLKPDVFQAGSDFDYWKFVPLFLYSLMSRALSERFVARKR